MSSPPPTRKLTALLLAALGAALGVLIMAPALARAEPRAELVIVEPGDAVWTRFGHIAIRVLDPDEDLDILFNYGYAPFDQPDFIWGYLRGEAEFELAVKRWDWSLERYRRWDRTVRRRELLLPPSMLQDLLHLLQVNARPENAGYLYDHLRDNCSTRVADLLDAVTDGALSEAAARLDPEATYRHFTLEAGSGRPLVQVIFDLIGGPNQEQPVDGVAALYLPRFVEAAAVATELPDGRPLVGAPIIEYERRGAAPTTGDLGAGRRLVTAVGLALGLLLMGVALFGSRKREGRFITRLAGLVLAVAALLMVLLSLALIGLIAVSEVPDFVWNDNVLVFLPLDLIWVGTGLRWLVTGRPTVGSRERFYTALRLVLLAAYAVGKVAGLFPQDNWVFVAAASAIVVGLFTVGRANRLGSRSEAQFAS